MSASTNSNARKKEYYADSIYVDGNTIRRQQAVPKRQPEAPHKSRREIEEERARRAAASRNLQRSMAMSRGYIVFLTAATAICFVICLTFIHLQSNISTHMSTISSMETALSNQKASNDLIESRLETAMTLDEVKDRAEELGLVYPSTAQIQYFSVEDSDYMNQYTDVASR